MEMVITDRGRSVGKIIPLRESRVSLADRIGELEIRGVIEERKSKPKTLPPPIPIEGSPAHKFLQESRNRG
jgi:antitoxin (DNA-binding transcriptional repressor) of toxin-antitoxin stability system